MSKTVRDNHQWKAKERKRTDKSDPTKIALHRGRVIANQANRKEQKVGYSPVVFQARLRFLPEEMVTELLVDEVKVADIPFLVEDPSSCHYALISHEFRLDITQEEDALSQYVQKTKFRGKYCRLSRNTGGERICGSIIDCPYRRWLTEKGAKCILD